MTTDVTVISCLYGQSHDRFLYDWLEAIRNLDPAPVTTVLATDRPLFMPEVFVVTHRNHDWTYPQAFYMNSALEHVETEWVWINDIDDLAFPDALDGVEDLDADVFQFGFRRSDGEIHIPSSPSPLNQLVAGSCVRAEALRSVGGFRDVALQDCDLWLRLRDAGVRFEFSDRPRFYYRRHPAARGVRELTLDQRERHMAELAAA
jgi:hypothetical protein